MLIQNNHRPAYQIINMIAEALAEADGKLIEQIANQVLNEKVKYIGDSMFNIGQEVEDGS